MSGAASFQTVLALLIIGVAAWTVVVRETFSAIVGFVAYGLLLALAWVCLLSIDVAITETAIGSGLTGALLLFANARLPPARQSRKRRALETATAVLLSACLSLILAAIVLLLPNPAPTLAPLVEANLARTGLGNPVTAVLMAYRALDTLLETVVVLLALIGVWSLTPDQFWGGRPGLEARGESEGALVLLAQVLAPLGIIVGVYLAWVSADAPGGKFPGAAVLAAMWMLALVAGRTNAPPINRFWLRMGLVAGPLVFLLVGFLGFGIASGFLAYPEKFAKPLIPAIESASTLSVAATLGLLVAGPPGRS